MNDIRRYNALFRERRILTQKQLCCLNEFYWRYIVYNLSLGVVKMFYPSFGTKQVEIFLFIKLKSAILIFKNWNCAFCFPQIYCEEASYNVNIVPPPFHSTVA